MKHILIVRPGAIGDTLLTLPILKALRTCGEPCSITFVGNAVVLPLLRATSFVDETFDFDSLLWSEIFASDGIRTAILRDMLHKMDEALCWLRDSDGVVFRNLQTQGISRVLVAPGRSETPTIHSVTYLAESIGLTEHIDMTMRIELDLPAHDALSLSLLHESRPFCIHPGSGGGQKCWPVSHFASVIQELWKREVPVLLLSGPADTARLAQLLRVLPSPPSSSLFTLLRDAPLLAVAMQLQRCRGYLGNDSGMTHLAALLGVPTYALFGPTDPAVWHPVGPCVQVIYQRDMALLSVQRVVDALQEIL